MKTLSKLILAGLLMLACCSGDRIKPFEVDTDLNGGGTDTGNPNNDGGTDTGNPNDGTEASPAPIQDTGSFTINGTWIAFDTECDEGCPGNNPTTFTIDASLHTTVTFEDGTIREGTASATINGILITFGDGTVLGFTFVDQDGDGQFHELFDGRIYYHKL